MQEGVAIIFLSTKKTVREVKENMKKLYSNKWVILSLVLPGLLLFVFAILAPICLSVYYGFTDYSGMGSYHFIGLDNYKALFHDKAFGLSLRNSLFLAIGFICIQHPLAMIVAAVLDKLGGKGESFFRCVYFIPNVISVAVIAYLWKFIYNPDFGLLNNLIKLFGGKGDINWFSYDTAIWALLIPYVAFSLPPGLFLMTSFMESIPVELEEAAVMDGCGIYRIIFQIITPMLKSSIATVAIMTFLNNWNEFMMASTYLSSDKWKTLPFSVLEFTGEYSSNYAVQFAVMALTAAPAVIVYIILNKHITKGVAMGAVKG